MKRVIEILLSLALLALVSGCSRSHPPSAAYEADRLVATNRYRIAACITVTGAEAKRIADAVASSTEDRTVYPDVKDCQIEFYHGTNLLSVIYV